ncbi:MAG: type I 3-dehydroquinate dehydratase [Planctomycetota bacterium]
MTRLCVPLSVPHPDAVDTALADAARAAEFGADLIEWRVDALAGVEGGTEATARLIEQGPLPCVLTCRHADEGGAFDGDEADRVALLHHASKLARPPAYLDVEWAKLEALPAPLRAKLDDAAARCGLIASAHDFTTRPAHLDRTIAGMAGSDAVRVAKLAWRARSIRDNVEAFEIVSRRLKPTVALCMGEDGLASRVLAKKFGALLTFASLDDARGTAPGQPTLDEIKNLYRWDALTLDTKVFGVIGHPVGHSMSPAIHNAAFDRLALDGEPFDGVYLPLPIPDAYEAFKATMLTWLDFEPLHFRGASVTIPHKANLLRFVREQGGRVEALAEQIGAANTLTVGDDGALHATNTDYAAILDATCDRLGVDRSGLRGLKVAVFGAGGVARAIVAGFAHHGAGVTVFNRTPERAQALAEAFGVTAAPLDAAPAHAADVWINGTSVGMSPGADTCVLAEPPTNWNAETVVFDTVYNPMRTALLALAESHGCRTIDGVDMFVRQAAAQFTGWTRRPAPIDAMRRVVVNRLTG